MNSLAPLRYAPFRYLLAGRTVNALGNAVAPIALAFAVLDLTGSPRDLGLVVGIRTLANVVFVLFGGVLADRLPRHLLMVGTSLAAAATQAAIAVTVLTGTATITVLVAMSALNGVFSALAWPASSALLPQTVPADVRQQANGLNRLFFSATAIVGASAGGVLVATVGPGWGIAADAATFALAAVLFGLVRVLPSTAPDPIAKPSRSSLLGDLRTGWTEFASRTWLWVVVAGFCLYNACFSGGLNVLGPVIADDTFGRQAWGFILSAETLGMVLGAVVAMRLRIRRLLYFGVVCTAFGALPLLALGVAPVVGVLLVTAFVAGLAIEQFGIAWETTMQEHVPEDRLARVYSYDMLGSLLAMPVGQVVAGPIAQAIGPGRTLVGAAALMGLAVVGMLASRDVRHLQHRLPARPEPVMEQSAP
jgi:MFS family permease